jgi:hypothetical protein
MALDFRGVTTNLFKTSRAIDDGINEKKQKEGLLTLNGCKFKTIRPQTDTFHYEENGHLHITAFEDPQMVFCEVELPQGAVINTIGVYGTHAAPNLIQFKRTRITTGAEETLYNSGAGRNAQEVPGNVY